MDIVYEVSFIAFGIGGLLAGAFFSTSHRDLALWSTCFAIVAAVIGGFAWWQDCLWESDVNAAEHDIMEAIVPSLRVPLTQGKAPEVEAGIVNGAPVRLRLIGASATVQPRNKGDVDFAAEQDRQLRCAQFQESIEEHQPYLTPGNEAGFDMQCKTVLDETIYPLVMAGEKVLYFIGGLIYEDSQNNLRGSTYCYYYDIERKKFFNGPAKFNKPGLNLDREILNVSRAPALVFDRLEMLSFAPDSPVGFNVFFKNTGGLTATLTQRAMSSSFGFINEENDRRIKSDFAEWERLPPETATADVSGLSELIFGPSAKQSYGEEFFKDTDTGARAFFIWGRLEYTDQDGGCYWTKFCLTYDGKKFEKYGDFNQNGKCSH